MRITKKIAGFAMVLAILMATASCVNIQDVHVGNIRNVDLKSIHNNTLTLQMIIPIENPNPFNLKIKQTHLKVLYGDKEIGNVKQVEKLVIKRSSSRDYPVTITVEITDLNNILNSAFGMFTGRAGTIQLDGTLVVKAFMYQKTIKLEKFALPQE